MDLLTLLAKLTLDASEYTKSLDEAQKAADNFKAPEVKPLTVGKKDFEDDLDEAGEKVNIFQELVNGSWEGIKDGLKRAGIATLLGKLVTDLGKAVKMTAELGDETSKGAAKMGLSRKTYQEFSYALEKSGGSIKNLEQGMKNLDNIFGGNATEKQQKAFETLGIEIEKAASSEELMLMTLNAIADRSESDQGYLLRTLFGDKNDELFNLIKDGSKGIRELRQEANDVGRVMSDAEIENSIAYMDALERMQNQIQEIKTSFGESILPIITEAVQGLTRIIAFFGGLGKNKSLSDIFADGDKEFAEQLMTIEKTGTSAESLADKLLAMGDTSKMTAEQYEIWKGTAKELIDLVPSLGNVIDTETGQITANSEEIKENIKQWEALAKQKALQTLKEEKYQAIVEKNQDLIDKSIEANEKAATADGERATALENLNNVLTGHGFEALGSNATLADVTNAQTNALLGFEGDEYALAQFSTEMSSAISNWTSANAKAEEAQAEVTKLTEELEKGKAEYETWVETAEAMYGTAADSAETATGDVEALNTAIKNLPNSKVITISVNTPRSLPRAIGDSYIPYDNFPALLHRGEKVLTATQARQEGSTDFTGLEDRIERAIRNGMANAKVNSYLNGQDITDDVNRNTIRELKARRFSP